MAASSECRKQVIDCLQRFLESTGRSDVSLDDRTDLARDIGLESDEGVDFVLDLCDAFGIDIPNDFNPVVHDSGRRGRRVGELVEAMWSFQRRLEVSK